MTWWEFVANIRAIRRAIKSGKVSKERVLEIGTALLDKLIEEGEGQ